jgi:cold shock protein
MRVHGTVKWFNDAKGFGFIGRQGGQPDVFVHFSGISAKGKGRRTLNDGDEVEFEVGTAENGRTQAVNVVKLASADRA